MRLKCWSTASRTIKTESSDKRNQLLANRRPPGRLFYFYPMAFKREKVYDLETARVQIRKYCTYQERCQSEVEERLRSMGIVQTAQDDLLGELISEGFLSEERFARAFVRGKHRAKGWGRVKITHHLKAKRVSVRCIQLGLSELDTESYLQTLTALLAKSYPWATRQEEQSALTAAQRKGYTWEEIETAKADLQA
jgi:regulatory protein